MNMMKLDWENDQIDNEYDQIDNEYDEIDSEYDEIDSEYDEIRLGKWCNLISTWVLCRPHLDRLPQQFERIEDR